MYWLSKALKQATTKPKRNTHVAVGQKKERRGEQIWKLGQH
jgi:hypothetical protein